MRGSATVGGVRLGTASRVDLTTADGGDRTVEVMVDGNGGSWTRTGHICMPGRHKYKY